VEPPTQALPVIKPAGSASRDAVATPYDVVMF
jgi:hypothetical protein